MVLSINASIVKQFVITHLLSEQMFKFVFQLEM